MRHIWLAAVCGVLAVFGLISLIGLDRLPLVYMDEPWIAEPGLLFWQHGAFVSELHRGLFGAERHFQLHAPAFSLMLGAVMALFGHGLLQARLLSLAMAIATLALTFWVGRTLLSPRHGLLAVVVLAVCRVATPDPMRLTGIPLFDLARIARYDVPVALFGLAALSVLLPLVTANPTAIPRFRRTRLLVAGALAGVSFACHPVGLVWIVICVVALILRSPANATSTWNSPTADGVISDTIIVPATPAKIPIGALALLLAGTTIVLIPWTWFLIDGWADLVAQQRIMSGRYSLLKSGFYIANITNEWRRYRQIFDALRLAQPGAWLLAIGIVSGTAALWLGADRRRVGARLLRLSLPIAVLLFATGVAPKDYHYVASIWPLLALTAAAGIAALLRAPMRAVRIGAIALLVVACGDGARTTIAFAQRARAATSYAALCDRLAATLTPDTRLLAFPSYWFGLAGRVRAYRSMVVPLTLVVYPTPDDHRPLANRLDDINADVVLLDPQLMALFSSQDHNWKVIGQDMHAWLDTHTIRRAVVDDPSYGHFELYFLRR